MAAVGSDESCMYGDFLRYRAEQSKLHVDALLIKAFAASLNNTLQGRDNKDMCPACITQNGSHICGKSIGIILENNQEKILMLHSWDEMWKTFTDELLRSPNIVKRDIINIMENDRRALLKKLMPRIIHHLHFYYPAHLDGSNYDCLG